MAKLGRIGSQSVAEKFDQRAQVRRLEEVYLQIIAGRGD
jgi:hypothetical protein